MVNAFVTRCLQSFFYFARKLGANIFYTFVIDKFFCFGVVFVVVDVRDLQHGSILLNIVDLLVFNTENGPLEPTEQLSHSYQGVVPKVEQVGVLGFADCRENECIDGPVESQCEVPEDGPPVEWSGVVDGFSETVPVIRNLATPETPVHVAIPDPGVGRVDYSDAEVEDVPGVDLLLGRALIVSSVSVRVTLVHHREDAHHDRGGVLASIDELVRVLAIIVPSFAALAETPPVNDNSPQTIHRRRSSPSTLRLLL